MKKIIASMTSIMLVLSMMLALSVSVFAADETPATRSVMVPQTKYYWTHTKKGSVTKTEGSWTLLYSGHPATQNGEVDTVSKSVEYTHTFSGSFAATIKEKIQVELGYSFGKSNSFSVSRSSRALKKGEYVKGYYIKTYEVTEVLQTEYKNRSGWTQTERGGAYHYINETTATGNKKTAYAKKAISPQIKLEYFSSKPGRSTRNAVGANGADEHLVAVEYYEMINGKYELVRSETRP